MGELLFGKGSFKRFEENFRGRQDMLIEKLAKENNYTIGVEINKDSLSDNFINKFMLKINAKSIGEYN